MRLLPFLAPALLAATTYAEDPAAPEESPAVEEPTPVGALWNAEWTASTLKPFTEHCRNKNTYHAKIYKLNQLYPDLTDQAPDLKVFYNRQRYAGSWGGIDVHGYERELMRMDIQEIPFKVREWLKENPKQRHFSVQKEEVFFAPGAIYPLLPLWVDEPEDMDTAECDGVFDDLETYSNEPKDGAVIGKISHTNTGEKEVKFTVEALKVTAKAAAGKDEL